ncbi:MAG: galactose mutarotase [Gammaproteobacteria bacterium]|nr:galactose mutarotase [Gammaproteobacteria bacterium]
MNHVLDITNDHIKASFMALGATWLSCQVRIGGGWREVILGHADLALYQQKGPYFGATVGRFANRIAGGTFSIDGQHYQVDQNEAPNTLHGGRGGFSHQPWRVVEHTPTSLRFAIDSPDGDQGFPGHLHAEVEYCLSGAAIDIIYHATTDAPCPVGLTNHAYFNLDAEHDDISQHRLQLAATQVLEVDMALIPTGALLPVGGTAFDLNTPRRLAEVLSHRELQATQGYDHALVLEGSGFRHVGRLTASDESLAMDIHTDQPSIQLYSGNGLEGIKGRNGPYRAYAGYAIETQGYPDSPNHAHFPNCILRPSEQYQHRTRYAFKTP